MVYSKSRVLVCQGGAGRAWERVQWQPFLLPAGSKVHRPRRPNWLTSGSDKAHCAHSRARGPGTRATVWRACSFLWTATAEWLAEQHLKGKRGRGCAACSCSGGSSGHPFLPAPPQYPIPPAASRRSPPGGGASRRSPRLPVRAWRTLPPRSLLLDSHFMESLAER